MLMICQQWLKVKGVLCLINCMRFNGMNNLIICYETFKTLGNVNINLLIEQCPFKLGRRFRTRLTCQRNVLGLTFDVRTSHVETWRLVLFPWLDVPRRPTECSH